MQCLRLLMMTKTKLELISEIDMCLLVQKGTRGSIFDIKDTVKPIINTWNVMIIVNQVNIYHVFGCK